MSFNPYALWPTCLLFNKATQRWHYISFRPAPRPSGYEDHVQRFKSKGHHTRGFDTKEEAIADIKKHPEIFEYREEVFNWDGVTLPACTGYFAPLPEKKEENNGVSNQGN